MWTKNKQTGFTIVELLIVIVIIGILAAITIVAYNGIQSRAIAATLQSDLDSASKQLKIYQVDNGAYPTSNDCSATPAAGSICLKSSGGASYTSFQVSNATTSSQAFCLTDTNGAISYRTTNNSTPTAGTCTGVMLGGTVCPSGFIVVPGSSTYSTSDFCVMKYEAKQSSATVPIAQAAGSPWTSISQTNAISYSQNVAGCAGCHLISEAEWLTIAQNVISVASNWSGGSVGSGYIYSGHNDGAPNNALAADGNDANGYSSETNNSGNQRRTLTLTNGEVIWDFAGNVWEWTQGTIAGGQQPGLSGEVSYAWKQWNNGLLLRNGLPSSAYPSYGTPAASGWTTTQGMGQLLSNGGEPSPRGFFRAGDWQTGSNAGIYTLYMSYDPSGSGASIGFRVSR